MSRTTGFAALCFVTLASCGSSGAEGDGAYARELLTDLSSVERAYLADKEVSFGEYESSVQHARDCLQNLGFSVEPATLGQDGLLVFFYGLDDTSDTAEVTRMETQAGGCFAEVSAVEAVYSLRHSSSEEERKEAEREFRACASALGVEGAAEEELGPIVSRMYEMGYAGELDVDAGKACIDIIGRVSVRPVPGLAEALADLA